MNKKYTMEELKEALEVKKLFDQLELLKGKDIIIVLSFLGAHENFNQSVFGTLNSIDRYTSITLSHNVTSNEICNFFSKIFLKEITYRNANGKRIILYEKKAKDWGTIINDAMKVYVSLSDQDINCFSESEFIDRYIDQSITVNKIVKL